MKNQSLPLSIATGFAKNQIITTLLKKLFFHKSLFIGLFLILCSTYSFGITYTTTGNGAYNNCAIWSPGCPPTNIPAGDSVIINHDITMTGNIDIDGVMIINVGATFTGSNDIKISLGGELTSDGDITTTGKLHVDGAFYNTGYAIFNNVHNDGYICNSGTIEIDPSKTFKNHGGLIECGGTIFACFYDFDPNGSSIPSTGSTIAEIQDQDLCCLDGTPGGVVPTIDLGVSGTLDTGSVTLCNLSFFVDAGPDTSVNMCNTIGSFIDINTLIGASADAGGVLAETTGSGAFNPVTGIFTTDGLAPGIYTFTYTVIGVPPLIDVAEFTVIVQEVVIDNAVLSTFPSGNNISCSGANDGSIDISVSGGIQPYIYNWTTVGGSGLVPTSEDQSGLTAGFYSVTITDSLGCTVNQTYILSEPTPLTESITAFLYPSGDNISCFGLADGSIDLTNTNGSPGYTYAWTTPDGSGLVPTNEDQSGLTAGTYNVTTTDLNGCTITSSITLTEPTPMTEATSAFIYPSGDNISCFGLADGSIDLTNTDGSPGYTYEWTTPDGSGLVLVNEDQSGLTAGTYNVTTTDLNGCTITSSITLIEPTQMTEATSAFAYPSGDNISCFGLADGSIDLTNTDGSPGYTYTWTTPDGSGLVPTNEDQSGLTAGTYNVTTTDLNGCTITSSITLAEPTPITEATSAFTYPSGDNISCFGLADGSVDLTNTNGSPGYTYAWTTPDGSGLVPTNEDQSGLTAGTYNVTTTDLNGCTITSSITLTEPTPMTEATSAFTYPSGDNISCFGLADGSIDLTNTNGSPGYTYAWTTPDGSGLVPANEDQSGLTAGTYNVTTTDLNGCTITSSITLVEPTPLTEATSALSYPSGDNISCFGLADGSIDLTNTNGSPGYTYAWTTPDGSGLVPANEDQSGLTAGTYNVTTTDLNGCTITSSITLSEPTPLTEATSAFAYPSGDNISCFGLADGSIDLTNTNGSPGYTYAWTTPDGSGLVPANEDQSGLTAGTYNVTTTDLNGCTITSSITLVEPTPITEATSAFTYPSGDNISCFGLADGSIDLTNTNGSPGYTYAWTTPDGSGLVPANEDQSGLTAGTYNVTTTDLNGCTITSSITLVEPTSLTEATSAFTYPSGDNISCFGLSDGSIDLTNTNGSPGYSYAWTTPDGSGLVPAAEDQSGLTAGTYNVTTTDINGCTITSSITLVEPTPLTEATSAFTYPSGDNISCFGLADGSIDLTNTNGSPGYTYAWTTPDGSGLVPANEDQSGLTAGTYNVTTTDLNGCTITSSITLVEPTPMTEATSAFTYPSGDNISCFGLADGSIDLTNTNGSPGYTYAWTTPDGSGLVPTNEDQSGLTAGTYNVTTTDLNGCIITSSITLSEPTPLTESTTALAYPSGDNISCFGLADGSIDLTNTNGSPGYTYAWTTPDGSGLVPTNEDQSGLTAGTYNVTTTDLNGCTITSSITLVEPTPLTESTTALVYPSGDNISCFGLADGSIDLTNTNGSPGYTYAWTTPDGSGLVPANEDQSGLTAGTYNVTTTDLNGCTITSSITLVEPTPLTEATSAFTYPSGDNISCFGLADGSIDLTNTNGSPGYTYAWTTPDGSGLVPTNEDQSGLTAGTYNVTTTDLNGCTIMSSITLVEPTPLTEATSAFIYPSGDNISCFGLADGSIDLTNTNGSPGYTYAWTTPDGSGLVPANEDQSGLTAGTYNVTTTDLNGCTITSSITLIEPTPLTEATSAFTYPSGDNISCFGLADGSIDLTNTNGSPGYTYAWTTPDGSGLAPAAEDQSGLTAGTYNVTTTDLNGCTITSSITLVEPTPLTESTTAFTYPSGDNISCFGLADGSIDLTITDGSPGYIYAWITAGGSGLIPAAEDQSGLTAGDYTVITTDLNGCTIISSITLVEPTPLTEATTAFTYPSGDNISCFGLADGSIDLTNTNGSPGYTYAWTTPDGSGLVPANEDQSGLTAGTYNVTTTDLNGCTVTSSITLSEPTPLTESTTALAYPSGDNISCFGLADGSIDLTNTNGSPGYTYAWTTPDGSGLVPANEDQSGLTAGTYNVTTTDLNGCTITSSITLSEPTPMTEATSAFIYPSGDNISCFGLADGSIDLTNTDGSPGYTYAWTTPNGSGLVPANEDQSGLTAGTYNVTTTDLNGCTITSSITLVEPTPMTEATSAFTYPSGENISCFGLADGSIDLTNTNGSPGYTYAWTTPDGSGLVPANEDQSGLTAGTYNVTTTDLNGCTITSSITLVEPTPLTESTTALAYLSGDNISCFGLADGSIDLTNTNGSPGYTYAWTTPDGSGLVPANEDQSGLTAGTYNVTTTDINGCTITSSITLVEPTPLTESTSAFAYPSGDNISCFGLADGSIDLTNTNGSPGYTYAWTTPDGSGLVPTNEDQSGLTAGTYNVTTTDINGCTITSSITLIEPAPLATTLMPSIYAGGFNVSQCIDDGTIDLTVTGGSPIFVYDWDMDGTGDFDDLEDLSSLWPGWYVVELIDVNGCSIMDSIQLTVPNALNISAVTSLYPSGDNISCFGANDGSIDFSAAGGVGPYTYDWDTDGLGDNDDPEDLFGLTAGSYYIIIHDQNNCPHDTTIVLTEPTQLTEATSAFTYPSGDNISCFGLADGSIDLTNTDGSPGYSYAWTTPDGSGLIPANEDQSSLTSGTYNVTTTDINGCTITSSITLVEPTQLTEGTAAFTYPSGSNVSCFGATDGSIDLTNTDGSPGYIYAWTTPDGSGLVPAAEDQSGLSAGTYDVTTTDINGCTITSNVLLSEPVQMSTTMSVTTDYNGQNVSCLGATDGAITVATINGSPAYTYEWFDALGVPFSTDINPTGLGAGVYDVTVTDINGCQVSDQITIIDAPQITSDIVISSNYSGQDISCFGLSDGSIDFTMLGGTPGYTFTWIDSNGGVIGATEDMSGLPAGTYTINAVDVNGCFVDTSITITQPPALSALTAVTSDYNGQDISCFQLSDGAIEVTSTGGTPLITYAWFDQLGNPIGATAALQGLPAGTYSVEVTDANGCQAIKDIVVSEPPALTLGINTLSDYFGLPVSCSGQLDGEIEAVVGGGTPSFSYAWDAEVILTTQVLSNIGEGTYVITVVDINGCTITDSITLVGNPLPTISPDGGMEVCLGETVTFGSNPSPGDACRWVFSNGMVLDDCGPNTLYIAEVGCFDANLIVTSALGCVDSLNMGDYVCIRPNPIAGFSASTYETSVFNTGVNFVNESFGATDYYWDFNDGSTSTDADVFHQFPMDNPNSYNVVLEVVNEYGCVDTTSAMINIKDETLFFVPNTFTPDGNQYNNTFGPVIGAGVTLENYQFMIFNRWGEVVFQSTTLGEMWDGTYLGNLCQDGTYTWKLFIQASDASLQAGERMVHHGHVTILR